MKKREIASREAIVTNCQIMSRKSVTIRKNPIFGANLLDAFGGIPTNRIAIELGVTYHAARNYLLGRVPAWDVLVKISDVTNCSIHWLLTDEGPKEREIIKAIAEDGLLDYDKLKRDAVIDFLLLEARELINNKEEDSSGGETKNLKPASLK